MSHKADRVAVVLNGNARQVTDELVESFDQLVERGDLFLSKSLDEAHGIAINIVDDPDAVEVEEEEIEGRTILHLYVADDDMGKVIGKRGQIGRAHV